MDGSNEGDKGVVDEITVCGLEGWVFLRGGEIFFTWASEDVDKSSFIGGLTKLDVGMAPNVVMGLYVEECIGESKDLGTRKHLVVGNGLGLRDGDEEEACLIGMGMVGLVV